MQVTSVAVREFENAFQLSTAMIQQTLLAADQQGCQVFVDVSRLDAVDLLSSAASLHLGAGTLQARGLAPMTNFGSKTLPNLKHVPMASSEPESTGVCYNIENVKEQHQGEAEK